MLSGGYGVALTAAPVYEEECPPETWSAPPAGVMRYPTRLGELLPPGARSDAELAEELARIGTARSRLAAYEAQLIRELAARRPAAADPRPPGVPAEAWDDSGISDFLPDELAMICNCSRAAATGLLDTALTWTGPLTATWAALADGRIDPPRARALAAELGRPARETDPGIVAAVEAAILPRASSLSVRRLRERIRAELIARDDAAAERRRREAERAADVRLRRLGDGLTELAAALPTALASACREAIDGYARLARAAGEPGSLGQLRAGVLADLILRPWDTRRPPVTATLTLTAPLAGATGTAGTAGAAGSAGATGSAGGTDTGGTLPVAAGTGGDCTGEDGPTVNGQPITAAQLRAILEQLDAACPGGLQAPAGGSLSLALVDPASGALRATVTWRELEALVRHGCPTHPSAACECAVLDRPPPTDGYRPTAAQRRFVTTRDRTCRHPGCDNRAGWADLDHVIPHAVGGPTDCANLCCLCRRHHRLTTFAPHWSFVMTDDGVLTVTTPSGVIRTTRPPGLRLTPADPDDDVPPF